MSEHYLDTISKNEALKVLYDPWLRLNSLYYIKDKRGRKVLFKANEHQAQLYREMWYLNVILKARQLGFTTMIDLFILDKALFNSNMSLGVVADRIKSAQKIFKEKILYPYQNLPTYIRDQIPTVRESTTEIEFANGSSIYVDTSMRGGTLQILHVSEYGKMCAKTPEKANEVKTGALNTLEQGQLAFIESTAEGEDGHFHDLSMRSMHKDPDKLTPLDYRFHFYPWWENKSYTMSPVGVHIRPEMQLYFETLERERGIVLTPGQKAWYVKKEEDQREYMTREYPSYPEEAFKAAIEGSIFGREMAYLDRRDQICHVPYNKHYPVHVYLDIGMSDYLAAWYVQHIGTWSNHIKYFEGMGISAPLFKRMLDADHKKHGMRFIIHAPHDVKVNEWGSGKMRLEILRNMNLEVYPVRKVPKADMRAAGRTHLANCRFDKEECATGIKHLRGYRFEWNEKYGRFDDNPRHDEHSHGADAFMYEAVDHSLPGEDEVSEEDQHTVTEREDPDEGRNYVSRFKSGYDNDDDDESDMTEGYYVED